MGELAKAVRAIATSTVKSTRRRAAVARAVAKLEKHVAELEANAHRQAALVIGDVSGLVVRADLPLKPSARGTLKMRDWQIDWTCERSCETRAIVVAILEPDAPISDLLERRGTELIEAGEKLLAEYERQRKEAV